MKTPTVMAAVVVGTLAGFLGMATLRARPQQEPLPTFQTVWDGVYTSAQAMRGQEWANQFCVECHGDAFAGGRAPTLRGPRFMENWRDGALDNIFDHMFIKMPPERPRGEMTAESYLEILSYVLAVNEFPAGSKDLSQDALWTIQLIEKDGPKPIPSQSAMMTAGCLTQNPDKTWTLTNTIEPVRNKKLDETNPMEMKVFAVKPLGTLGFRLNNIAGYNPDSHIGHKMLVKGVLSRQAAGDRINVTLMEAISTDCR